MKKWHPRETVRTDKVETSMDTQVLLLFACGLLFLTHVRFVLVVDKVDNGRPAVRVSKQLPHQALTLAHTPAHLSRLLT